MGVRASNLCKPRTCTFEYGGEPVEVTYTQQESSVAFVRQLRALEGGHDEDAVVVALSRVLIAWDVLDDNDKPLPTTEAVLETLPFPFLMETLVAIRDDVVGGKGSGAGSLPGAPSATAPNGTPESAPAGI